jgi:NADH dehydrogenase
VDRTNHHLFQPLLYQVATAGLSAPAVRAPIRHILRSEMQRGNLTVLLGEVTAIDAAARASSSTTAASAAYDHLIVAAGATHSYFGHDDWAAHAPGLKTLADAFEIRAACCWPSSAPSAKPRPHRAGLADLRRRRRGPTGVEMAGTMAEIAQPHAARASSAASTRARRASCWSRAAARAERLPEKLSTSALEQLRTLGVEVLTSAKVTGSTPTA